MSEPIILLTEATGQKFVEIESVQDAVNFANSRIRRNQHRYGYARRDFRYAVCKIVCWVEPATQGHPQRVVYTNQDQEPNMPTIINPRESEPEGVHHSLQLDIPATCKMRSWTFPEDSVSRAFGSLRLEPATSIHIRDAHVCDEMIEHLKLIAKFLRKQQGEGAA